MLVRVFLLSLALAACAEPEVQDLIECGARTTEVDGVCVGDEPIEPDPVTLEAFLDTLEPCDAPESGDGRLDLLLGCADDVCARTLLREVNANMGEEADCEQPYLANPEFLECSWSNGTSTLLYDPDADGIPNDNAIVNGVNVAPTFDGTTLDGLGIGERVTCIIEKLGTPDALTLVETKEGWHIEQAAWDAAGVQVYDGGTSYPRVFDGRIDRLGMYGAVDPET